MQIIQNVKTEQLNKLNFPVQTNKTKHNEIFTYVHPFG